jgi:flagellar motor switch protein FliG
MPEQVADRPQGAERVAVLLMALGEEAAAEILRHLGPKEVQAIGVAMASLKKVSKTAVENTLNDFIRDVRNETALTIGADDYIRSVLVNALGEEKAGGMIDRILLGGNTKGLEALKWMDARAVVELIRYEHPQIIAIVLSYLDSDQAAEVLAEFPERQRADILLRVATLEGVQPAALQELNEILEKQLRGGTTGQSSNIGGVKAAANILNFVDSSIESAVMEQLKSSDAELAQQIEDLMFVFDNLVDVDDRGIQTLLREITTDNLVLALKAADEPLKQKFFKNMSQRAAEMLRDDLENRGPVRLSEVETAQKEIMTAARRLANAGQIVLGGAGGEKMV